ncbi:MAG: class I SAM-dependent methyltransferase [Sphingomonadaceae bacterium]|nr:class I SAM-dependent methyltransferase [Sphingomonadaceae bacterium]
MYDFVERASCPACRSLHTRQLFEAPFNSPVVGGLISRFYARDSELIGHVTYRLDKCLVCELVFQHYIGGRAFMEELYTNWVVGTNEPDTQFETYRRDIECKMLSRDAHEILTAAAFLQKPVSALKTLDYGMGWALWARIASHLGCDSYGSDLSVPRMDFAKRHGVKVLIDAELGGHRFDFINTEQVMEHLPRPLETVEALAGSLRPGGILKISVPLGDHASDAVRELRAAKSVDDWKNFMPVHPLEHINTFRRHSVRVMGAKAGLVEVRPNWLTRYAPYRTPGTWSLRKPRALMKELIRPYYQYHNSLNLYVWLRKPIVSAVS